MIVLKKNQEELAEEVMNKISLSKDKENLEKHVVNLSKCVVDLSKKVDVDLGDIKAKVIVALDYSGSMEHLYRDGTVQRTINRLVPLGLTFDDDGKIDMYLFSSGYKSLKDITLENYEDYVKNVIKKSLYSMGGTEYAPVLNAIIHGDKGLRNKSLLGKLFKSKNKDDNSDITFVLFITDGDTSDTDETNDVIIESSVPRKKTFIQFIGIGHDSFSYLEKLDNLDGRPLDNTGFSKMIDLEDVSDTVLYNNILSQFADWLTFI